MIVATSPTLAALRRSVVDTARRLPTDGLTVVSGGNVSARDPGTGLIAITPTAMVYATMTDADIVLVDAAGDVVDGPHPPSSEMRLHLELMGRFDEPGLGIVHTHSPYATAFSVARRGIPLVCNEGLNLGSPWIEVTSFAPPGTPELGRAVLEVLDDRPDARAILIANHGAVTIAPTISAAYDLALQLEWSARIYHLAIQIGQPRELDGAQMAEILARYHTSAAAAD
jgi:ribulose-5-phosphate 4-epimerase/fuculose-1-phosphate aldolase